ncbi:MAG: hypothetical protein SGILL_005167 [Bacillariaceae sp.]
MVFTIPDSIENAPEADRTAIDGVFRSPMRGIHSCGATEIACFVHVLIQASTYDVTALEYSRTHREDILRQEFGSWLLEDHIEKAVIATTMAGTVCFWNDYAAELYQYSKEEAMGQNIMELTPSEMSGEQAKEIFGELLQGKHWSGMFRVKKKDGSQFMAHVTDTPVMDAEGGVKFIVGVSADYSQLHNTMEELERLNNTLESEVQTRTNEMLAQRREAEKAKQVAALAAENNKAKTEMMQILTHELRTPLQGIMGVASTILQDLQPEESNMCESISTVLASSRVLLTLINNVLGEYT